MVGMRSPEFIPKEVFARLSGVYDNTREQDRRSKPRKHEVIEVEASGIITAIERRLTPLALLRPGQKQEDLDVATRDVDGTGTNLFMSRTSDGNIRFGGAILGRDGVLREIGEESSDPEEKRQNVLRMITRVCGQLERLDKNSTTIHVTPLP